MGSAEVEAASRAAADAIARRDVVDDAAAEIGAAAREASGAFERTGSNESVLVSSPSPSRDDNTDDDDAPPSSSGHHHHPPSPEPFLLHPILGPGAGFPSRYDSASFAITPSGASLTENNANGIDELRGNDGGGHTRAYNTSPDSLNWEECIDNLFNEIANGTSPGQVRRGDILGGRSPGEARSSDRTPAISNARSFMLKRRKGEAFLSAGGGGEIEYGRESRRLRGNDDDDSNSSVDGGSRGLHCNDGFSYSATDAPIQSFLVDFEFMSKSSTEVSNSRDTSRSEERISLRPSIKTNLPPASPPLTKQPPRHPAPPSLDDDLMADPLHPSMGTLERYDNELYRMLRGAHPTPYELPPPLVPPHAAGNRLAVVHGPSRSCVDYEVEDCVASRAYAFKKFLREVQAFEGCTYLLPGCREGVSDWGGNTNISSFGSFALGHIPGKRKSHQLKLNEVELTIARRRVHCAIYAFGGRVNRRRLSSKENMQVMSIFRTRNNSLYGDQSSTCVASDDGGSCGTEAKRQLTRTNSIDRYEDDLRQQYFEHGDRLSWDVEENLSLMLSGGSTFDDDDTTLKRSGSNLSDDKQQPSKKNRCKKCGQVKLGHVCPYVSSLLRNIGIMVYPSANAHVADEPGKLAPALCEMNNFISIKSGSLEMVADDRRMLMDASIGVGDKKERPCHDLVSGISPLRRKTLLVSPAANGNPFDSQRSNSGESSREAYAYDGTNDLLFQPKMEITPDQYRSVTPRDASTKSRRAYTYPQVPLTFDQRKSASDALFSLSKQVPTLTDEIALVLSEARERNQWDLAIAELMTQVICVLHCCPSNDYTLEGLRRYLLMLGIVC